MEQAVSRSGFMSWQKIVLPLSSRSPYYLVSGQNVVTVEYHASSKYNSQMSFDLRMLAQRRFVLSLSLSLPHCLLACIPAHWWRDVNDLSGSPVTPDFVRVYDGVEIRSEAIVSVLWQRWLR